MRTTTGSVLSPKGAPERIQRRRSCASRERGSSRLPPPCGMAPVGLSRTKLACGGGGHTPSARFARQREVVDHRLEAEQRQLEAVLSRRLAVAGARVAPELAEDRHNLIGE